MPTLGRKKKKPARRCKTCNYVIKEVPVGNGWAHKKKEHWLDRPHKAVPAPLFPQEESAA